MSRSDSYYWKCDRASAFHGITGEREVAGVEARLRPVVEGVLAESGLVLEPLPSQGNHLLWRVRGEAGSYLIRVEDGPEEDDYQVIEAAVLGRVRERGVATPKVLGVDASRQQVPFSWQVMEWIDAPNLQHWFVQGRLDVSEVMRQLGRAIARWQAVEVTGFGPFTPQGLADHSTLSGYHASYRDYFFTQWERHLHALERSFFLSAMEVVRIREVICDHEALLDVAQGCLVHKDLAFWNVLGSESKIQAVVDFDDCIAGDPLDDLSLLRCFHPPEVVAFALAGYEEVRPLPADWEARLAMCLLRNMIVKAVIRVGAGYFDRSEGFFLIAPGSSGSSFREETRTRLLGALQELEGQSRMTDFSSPR